MIDDPRLVLGLKIRALRRGQNLTLQQLSSAAGLSVSYLSEIEKGKKYPKPERLVALARALEVPFDDLVSLSIPENLGALRTILASTWMRAFPFELFNVKPEDLLAHVGEHPRRGAALVGAMAEVGRSYDVNVEHFLLAALRAYQQLHGNYFEELESAAAEFRRGAGWPADGPLDGPLLRATLERRWRYRVDDRTLAEEPDLVHFRSVFRPGPRPTLYLNSRLLDSQKTFLLAREIGYRSLGLEERALSSPWLEVESFDHVLHNFQASYFAGALLMPREEMCGDLRRLFSRKRWEESLMLGMMRRYAVTPETLLHRITQITPRFFGLDEFFFFRFSTVDAGKFRLTKWLNASPVPVPRGFGLSEHYCRRWPALALLARHTPDLAQPGQQACAASRTRFAADDLEFLELSMVRRLALRSGKLSAVSVGFRTGARLERAVAFAADPDLPRSMVGLTCERCELEDCRERTAPATLWDDAAAAHRKEDAVRRLSGRAS